MYVADSCQVSHLCASVHQAVQVGTGQRAVMPCGWGVKAGVCGWQVKLCDPVVTHGPYLSALEVQHDEALLLLLCLLSRLHLNLVNFLLCRALQQKLYCQDIQYVDQLKHVLLHC